MYILTCVRTHRHVVIKWSTDRLHSSSSDKKSLAVLHTMWVMLRMCSRIEQLWAMLCTGLTASASSFLLLSPFSNTLVDVCPFLRSEVIYTGRGGGRVYRNATHTTLSRTTLTSCLEGLRGGEHSVTSPHRNYDGRWSAPFLLGRVALFNHFHFSCLSCSGAMLYTRNPRSKPTMASQVSAICSAVRVWPRASCLHWWELCERTILLRKCHCSLIALTLL